MPAEAALRHLMTLNHWSTDRPIDRSRNPAKLTSCTAETLRGPRSITVVRVDGAKALKATRDLLGVAGDAIAKNTREGYLLCPKRRLHETLTCCNNG